MPTREGNGGQFRDTAYPIDNDFYLEPKDAIVGRYR